MAAVSTIISTVAAIATAANAIKSFTSKPKSPRAPSVQAPPVPTGPALEPDKDIFSRPGPMEAPAQLQLGSGLSPLQQRSQIATRGVAGSSGAYRDTAAKDFYTNITLRGLTDESGKAFGSPLPIERQFLEQVFGVTPRKSTTESFLSALLRG